MKTYSFVEWIKTHRTELGELDILAITCPCCGSTVATDEIDVANVISYIIDGRDTASLTGPERLIRSELQNYYTVECEQEQQKLMEWAGI